MSPAADLLADPGSFDPRSEPISNSDPLNWPDYEQRLDDARARSGSSEAITVGSATIGGHEVELALFEFDFMGGSMGEAVGEALARGLERAAQRGVPLILRTATGGARMQEGMRSLVQMPKLVIARRELAASAQPLIVVVGHPTTGGVLASIAALADVTVAEADATIGFAGPRVARAFTGAEVGNDSHNATAAFQNGLVDDVVPGADVRAYLVGCLNALAPDRPEPVGEQAWPQASGDLDPWDNVVAARSADRPSSGSVLNAWTAESVELRGDRSGTDDPAVRGACIRLNGRRVMVVALDRAHAPLPAGFKKARRCMEVAQRLAIPVVTLVDTKGADPSPASENAGLAWEIARTFDLLLGLRTPTLSVLLGEGGSGGALAFSATDVLLAYEKSIFSVIAPEAAAAILWKETGRAAEAARLLKPGAADLVRLGIADGVLPEPIEPSGLADILAYHLDRLSASGMDELLERRARRWRDDGNR